MTQMPERQAGGPEADVSEEAPGPHRLQALGCCVVRAGEAGAGHPIEGGIAIGAETAGLGPFYVLMRSMRTTARVPNKKIGIQAGRAAEAESGWTLWAINTVT